MTGLSFCFFFSLILPYLYPVCLSNPIIGFHKKIIISRFAKKDALDIPDGKKS